MTDLTQALAELRRVTPPNSPWEAGDLGVGSSQVDYHIATILNAALSGDLIPRADADLALALMVEKAAERLDANRAQLNFAAMLGLLRDAPLPESIVTALSGWLYAIADAIRDLAPASAMAELQALRDERDRLDAVTNTLSEMWEGEQTARHSAEADITTYQTIVADMTQEAEAAEAELVTLRAQVETTSALVRKLAYWLDTDAEVLADLDDRDMSDHQHIVAEVAKIAAALTEGAAP